MSRTLLTDANLAIKVFSDAFRVDVGGVDTRGNSRGAQDTCTRPSATADSLVVAGVGYIGGILPEKIVGSL